MNLLCGDLSAVPAPPKMKATLLQQFDTLAPALQASSPPVSASVRGALDALATAPCCSLGRRSLPPPPRLHRPSPPPRRVQVLLKEVSPLRAFSEGIVVHLGLPDNIVKRLGLWFAAAVDEGILEILEPIPPEVLAADPGAKQAWGWLQLLMKQARAVAGGMEGREGWTGGRVGRARGAEGANPNLHPALALALPLPLPLPFSPSSPLVPLRSPSPPSQEILSSVLSAERVAVERKVATLKEYHQARPTPRPPRTPPAAPLVDRAVDRSPRPPRSSPVTPRHAPSRPVTPRSSLLLPPSPSFSLLLPPSPEVSPLSSAAQPCRPPMPG